MEKKIRKHVALFTYDYHKLLPKTCSTVAQNFPLLMVAHNQKYERLLLTKGVNKHIEMRKSNNFILKLGKLVESFSHFPFASRSTIQLIFDLVEDTLSRQ